MYRHVLLCTTHYLGVISQLFNLIYYVFLFLHFTFSSLSTCLIPSMHGVAFLFFPMHSLLSLHPLVFSPNFLSRNCLLLPTPSHHISYISFSQQIYLFLLLPYSQFSLSLPAIHFKTSNLSSFFSPLISPSHTAKQFLTYLGRQDKAGKETSNTGFWLGSCKRVHSLKG